MVTEDPKQDAPDAGEEATSPGELPEIDFATFVLSLTTTGLYQMGLVPDPATGKPVAPNPVIAKQTIDTLEMLRAKTRGNLEPEEVKLLESLLYELKLRFVEIEK